MDTRVVADVAAADKKISSGTVTQVGVRLRSHFVLLNFSKLVLQRNTPFLFNECSLGYEIGSSAPRG